MLALLRYSVWLHADCPVYTRGSWCIKRADGITLGCCRDWVDKVDERGWRTTGPLVQAASFELCEEVRVHVEAVTCNDKGASTDADVYVRAHTAPSLGEATASDWARLPALVDSLERGMTDVFDIMLAGITGRLQKLDVRSSPCYMQSTPALTPDHAYVH